MAKNNKEMNNETAETVVEPQETKAEKKEKAESVDSSKKKPLPAPTKKSVEKAESSEEDMTETVSA